MGRTIKNHKLLLEFDDPLGQVRREFSDRPPMQAINDMHREMLKLLRQKPTANRITRAICLSAVSTDLVMDEWREELKKEAIRLGIDPSTVP